MLFCQFLRYDNNRLILYHYILWKYYSLCICMWSEFNLFRFVPPLLFLYVWVRLISIIKALICGLLEQLLFFSENLRQEFLIFTADCLLDRRELLAHLMYAIVFVRNFSYQLLNFTLFYVLCNFFYMRWKFCLKLPGGLILFFDRISKSIDLITE